MKIAYLASRVTLPGHPERREDAFEHDQAVAALEGPFRERGWELCPVSWDDAGADWSGFAAAIVGTTWDYWDRLDVFLATLKRIDAESRLFNPPDVIRWNSRKTYLRDLENRGVPTIPTAWIDRPSLEWIEAAFDDLRTDRIVLKRQVGAGAEGQVVVERSGVRPGMEKFPLMAQPFLPAVAEEGEWSFVFIDGELSHALLKKPAEGDYRVQSIYGGTEMAVSSSKRDREAAERVIEVLGERLLYARVDMLRDSSGDLRLIELEVIEPFLYPLQGPELGPRLARALAERLEP